MCERCVVLAEALIEIANSPYQVDYAMAQTACAALTASDRKAAERLRALEEEHRAAVALLNAVKPLLSTDQAWEDAVWKVEGVEQCPNS